jgi:phosphoglycolate phosphatase
MRAEMKRLVLFDIDGTLVHCGPTPRRVFKQALNQVFGTAGPIDGWIFDGKTDPLIVRELMEAAGVAWSQEQVDEALRRYIRYLESELRSEPSKKVFPGVRELLPALRDGGAMLGLLTGNMRAGARAKLESLNLWHYFACGGFADDSYLRSEIASAAVRRAAELAGRQFSGSEIVIIGDTPHDMQCGRHLGARAVGVATGRSSPEQLMAAGAEAALKDFSDTARAVELILR